MQIEDLEDEYDMTEELVREQLISLVGSHCCWGDGPAKDMKLEEITSLPALHYILESFVESRVIEGKAEPYLSGSVDGPENGQPPTAWEIPVQPTAHFTEETFHDELPHTATVESCYVCSGTGKDICMYCYGTGRVTCSSCGGTGRILRTVPDGRGGFSTEYGTCFACVAGYQNCWACYGSGKVTCDKCNGYKKLKCFLQLTTTFTIKKDDYVYYGPDQPKTQI